MLWYLNSYMRFCSMDVLPTDYEFVLYINLALSSKSIRLTRIVRKNIGRIYVQHWGNIDDNIWVGNQCMQCETPREFLYGTAYIPVSILFKIKAIRRRYTITSRNISKRYAALPVRPWVFVFASWNMESPYWFPRICYCVSWETLNLSVQDYRYFPVFITSTLTVPILERKR